MTIARGGYLLVSQGFAKIAMEARKTGSKRILVVDDEPDIRSIIQLILRSEGYTVTEAADGVEALALFAPGLFDLVLTDCEMPRINGIELVQRIRRLAPEQPIGLVSAHVDKMIGSLASVSFHLDKPFLNDDLRREVKRAMELD